MSLCRCFQPPSVLGDFFCATRSLEQLLWEAAKKKRPPMVLTPKTQGRRSWPAFAQKFGIATGKKGWEKCGRKKVAVDLLGLGDFYGLHHGIHHESTIWWVIFTDCTMGFIMNPPFGIIFLNFFQTSSKQIQIEYSPLSLNSTEA